MFRNAGNAGDAGNAGNAGDAGNAGNAGNAGKDKPKITIFLNDNKCKYLFSPHGPAAAANSVSLKKIILHRQGLQLTYIHNTFVTSNKSITSKFTIMEKLDPDKIMKIIEIIVTAILAICGTLLVANCTATMSISKYNNSSPQKIEQTTTSSVDSTTINVR